MDDFTSIKEAKADARVEPASFSDIDVGQSTPTLHASAPPSWARYLPGPSPTYRFKGLSRSLSRIGVTACGCMIFLLSGYNVALMGGVSSLPQYLQVVGLTDGSRKTELLIGTINAMYWIGVIFGALGVGWLSDTIGRRRALVVCLLYATIIIPIFASLQGFAWGLALRLLNGVAVGAIDSVGLNWTAETVDHKRRGLAIGTELVFAPTAASIAFFMVYALPQHSSSDFVWRFPLAFQLIFVAMISCAVCLLPESPRWLVKAGYIEAARDLHTRRRSLSAFFVQFSTQIMVGVGLVSAYGILLFETGGFAPDLAALLTGGAIATQALFGIPGAFLADKMGRRRAMWVGALISAVILLLIGVCGYFVDKHAEMNPDLAKTYGLVIICLVYVYCVSFGFTWLWVPFTYPSEIFPARSRTRGSSIGIAGFATSSFLVNMIGPTMFSAIGYGSLFLICGLAFIVTFVTFFFMPETAGKTLEEIDGLFD